MSRLESESKHRLWRFTCLTALLTSLLLVNRLTSSPHRLHGQLRPKHNITTPINLAYNILACLYSLTLVTVDSLSAVLAPCQTMTSVLAAL
jgi:hypothetical protein